MPLRRYYFLTTDNKVFGPVNLNVVAEMISAQKVKANSPVSVDGTEFKQMKSFPELATLLSVDAGLESPAADGTEAIVEAEPTYSGEITEISVPKLFFHFFAAKATGQLVLATEAKVKEFFLLNGKLAAAKSNLERDRLGRHLVHKHILSPEALGPILREIGVRNERLGDHLVRTGILKPQELLGHLKTQLLERFFEVFSWREGAYAFHEGREFDGPLLPFNLNPWETILEGLRRGYQLAELKELLHPFRNHLLLPNPNPHLHLNELPLQPLELRVFRLASDHRALGRALAELCATAEDEKIVLTTVYLGLELDLLTFGDEQAEPDPLSDNLGIEDFETVAQPTNIEEAHSQTAGLPSGSLATATAEEQRLQVTLKRLNEQDCFQRLGLQRTASAAEASKAFVKAARTFHPDNVPAGASQSLRELTTQIFSLFNEAQRTLSNEANRARYLEALEAGQKSEQVDVTNVVQAEALFQNGQALLRAGKFAQAREVFEEAVRLHAEEGEFLICLGYATFFSNPKGDPGFRDKCLQMIHKGLKMRNNDVADGFYFIGRIQKALGDEEHARGNFEKALSINPNLVEATRELRLMQMRGDKRSGLFKRKRPGGKS